MAGQSRQQDQLRQPRLWHMMARQDRQHGLAAGIWTRDVGRAHRVAAQIKAGQIYVNYYLEGSVEHPLGGYKKSGIGREKGVVAMYEYTQLKNVIINLQ